MFGLGMSEVILILVLALIVVGPKKLPEVAKSLGKGFAEFKKVMNDFKDAVNIDDLDEPSSSGSKNKNISEVYKNKWQQDILQAEEEDDEQKEKQEQKDDSNDTKDSENTNKDVRPESRET